MIQGPIYYLVESSDGTVERFGTLVDAYDFVHKKYGPDFGIDDKCANYPNFRNMIDETDETEVSIHTIYN